jgi:hypothetical protein
MICKAVQLALACQSENSKLQLNTQTSSVSLTDDLEDLSSLTDNLKVENRLNSAIHITLSFETLEKMDEKMSL